MGYIIVVILYHFYQTILYSYISLYHHMCSPKVVCFCHYITKCIFNLKKNEDHSWAKVEITSPLIFKYCTVTAIYALVW